MDSPPRGGHDETGLSHLPKRQKTLHHHDLPAARRKIYTVAWICALSIEMAAARAVLDTIHEPLPALADDSNTYVFGNIQGHNVVIACLPTDQYGIVNAANVATNIRRTFPAIRVGLMVGIGGGVPSQVDVRLGDIVVGTRVMQIDLGKIIHGDQQLERTAIPRIPHQSLGTAVTALRAKHEFEPSRIPSILLQKFEGCQFGYPISPDRLFQADYHHKGPTPNCDECDNSKLILRNTRMSKAPVIHYGAISSGSQVIKESLFRDDVARQLNVICFEMESAGLMDIIPCLPIRGICDYSDSHKSKEWQKYAAATAAAYAREFLEELHVTEIDTESIPIPTLSGKFFMCRR
jgi:nucleoside phosphorylase